LEQEKIEMDQMY